MTENEKTTALIPSVGADGGQPPHNSSNQSIPHETCESNPPEENIEEMRERIRRMNDPRYHLHVVYIPIVEKQILWSKRCKDKSLVGTVKETIQQVSMSKKWDSKPALDEHGKPLLNANGKTVLRKSYSVLQDDFFAAMRKAG